MNLLVKTSIPAASLGKVSADEYNIFKLNLQNFMSQIKVCIVLSVVIIKHSLRFHDFVTASSVAND